MSSVIFFLETKYFAHIGAIKILAKNLKKRKPDDHFHFYEKQNQILAKDISFVEYVQEKFTGIKKLRALKCIGG